MVQNIFRRSTKAICGITEREVVVPKSQKAATLRKLKKAGVRIIGVSYGDRYTTKIWFNKGGF